MFPWDSRRTRRSGRDRYRPNLAALESLEKRDLMAYSPLGMSLPDLTITGSASPTASWGGPLTVTVNVRNIGASTIIEPTNLTPDATSSADAPPTTVYVVGSRSPHPGAHPIFLGSFTTNTVPQNSIDPEIHTITLPSKPKGLPGDGGRIYVSFIINPTNSVLESNAHNNASKSVPVNIQAPFPDLVAVGLDVPPVMQPGDTIQPNIRIANLGPADTNLQGPVTVELVASTTPRFNKGSTVVASYQVANIPGTGQISTTNPSLVGDVNLIPQQNISTITGAPVTLPTKPGVYYIGVVIDPNNQIKQIKTVPQFGAHNKFSLAHVVGPRIKGLPPAGVDVAGGVSNIPVFPNSFGNLPIGGSADGAYFPAPFPPALTYSVGTTLPKQTPGTPVVPQPVVILGTVQSSATLRSKLLNTANTTPQPTTFKGQSSALNLGLNRSIPTN